MKLAPLCLWIMWFGKMGPTRRKSIERITRSAGVRVILLTEKNFTSVGDDLHPVATSGVLSKNHLSDYMRAYLMHKYGGAYQDVKPTQINWKRQLEALNGDDDAWFIGSDELAYFQKSRVGQNVWRTRAFAAVFQRQRKRGSVRHLKLLLRGKTGHPADTEVARVGRA